MLAISCSDVICQLVTVGAGYQLAMVKKSTCRTADVTRVVQSHVAGSRLSSDVSAELSYVLPQDSKADFSRLFTELDKHLEDLGIISYGASITTMDEVFIRLFTKKLSKDIERVQKRCLRLLFRALSYAVIK